MAKKVTIVEDDLNLLNSVAEKLRAEGYTVSTATDGELGWERVRADMPDLLVLDIMLKKLDGLSLCRMIRSDATTAHIPIIMMTARANEVDKIVGLESGADDYIVKPFGLGEFLARVRARLRQPSGSNPVTQTEMASGDIRVNMTGRRVFKEGQPEIKLSNKEFDLLVELMRNKNVVLSRDLILTKVWGYDYFVDKRTVDVHIRWLREKIEDDPSNPTRIVTVRGVGYRFEG